MCECERALVWARGMRLSRDGGEEGDRWGEIPLEVMKLLAASSTLVTAVLPGNRPSSRSSEGVTTELRFTGLDVGESGYRVPAGTLLSQ